MKKTKYGLVLGRFQPLHIGHMEYLEGARKECERLVIGITNPDSESHIVERTDLKRSTPANNPFTYTLRYEMIDLSLRTAGWGPDDFMIVPAFITEPKRMAGFLPPADQTTVFITVYDDWGDEKANRLKKLGFCVRVLWRRELSQRIISGTQVRRLIAKGKIWQHWVPGGVVVILKRAVSVSNRRRLRRTSH